MDSVAGQEIDIVAKQHADGQCRWEADGHFFGQCSPADGQWTCEICGQQVGSNAIHTARETTV